MGDSARTSTKFGYLVAAPQRGNEREQVGENLEALQPRRPAQLGEPRTGLEMSKEPARA